MTPAPTGDRLPVIFGADSENECVTTVVAYLRETRSERLLCLAARASHEAISTPFTNLETLYGDDANDGVLPAEGPSFHTWRIHG
jgi:hypothetical protein